MGNLRRHMLYGSLRTFCIYVTLCLQAALTADEDEKPAPETKKAKSGKTVQDDSAQVTKIYFIMVFASDENRCCKKNVF